MDPLDTLVTRAQQLRALVRSSASDLRPGVLEGVQPELLRIALLQELDVNEAEGIGMELTEAQKKTKATHFSGRRDRVLRSREYSGLLYQVSRLCDSSILTIPDRHICKDLRTLPTARTVSISMNKAWLQHGQKSYLMTEALLVHGPAPEQRTLEQEENSIVSARRCKNPRLSPEADSLERERMEYLKTDFSRNMARAMARFDQGCKGDMQSILARSRAIASERKQWMQERALHSTSSTSPNPNPQLLDPMELFGPSDLTDTIQKLMDPRSSLPFNGAADDTFLDDSEAFLASTQAFIDAHSLQPLDPRSPIPSPQHRHRHQSEVSSQLRTPGTSQTPRERGG